jgi:hypothetical protein
MPLIRPSILGIWSREFEVGSGSEADITRRLIRFANSGHYGSSVAYASETGTMRKPISFMEMGRPGDEAAVNATVIAGLMFAFGVLCDCD